MADSEYKRLATTSCACGATIIPSNKAGRKRKHCSDQCRERATNRKIKRAGIRVFLCAICGKVFNSPHKTSCCSDVCRVQFALKSQREASYALHKKTVVPILCRLCGLLFSPLYGFTGKAHYCSECRKLVPGGVASIRRRKRIKAASIEVVVRSVVFERDKWRCALCAIKTIKAPYKDNSAELDHIIPLALGGEHSYANTQCACRKCNGSKGAKAKGQALILDK